MTTPEPTGSRGVIEMPLERFEEIGAEMERLRSALETVTAQSAAALVKRDKAKQRARIAEAELETLRGGLRAIGGDPTQVQNLYAQLSLSNRQWKAAQATQAVNDAAWGSVWQHGKWSWLTKNMTTEQREYAADCVARWSAALDADDPNLEPGEPEGLRWWREPERQPAGLRGLLEHVGIDVAGRAITVDGVPIDDIGSASPTPEPPCGYCGCTTPSADCTTCNHDEESGS